MVELNFTLISFPKLLTILSVILKEVILGADRITQSAYTRAFIRLPPIQPPKFVVCFFFNLFTSASK